MRERQACHLQIHGPAALAVCVAGWVSLRRPRSGECPTLCCACCCMFNICLVSITVMKINKLWSPNPKLSSLFTR